MKKLLITLILLGSILISSFAFAITEEEARKYIGTNVFIILNCYIRPYSIYGIPVDTTFYEGEWYLVLKTGYYEQPVWFIRCKDIHYIRERKGYE